MVYEISTSDKISLAAIIVSFILGLLALWQTNREIKLSNKQLLFNKRFRLYSWLIRLQVIQKNAQRLYDEQIISNEADDIQIAITFYDEGLMLHRLTDNVDMYDIKWTNWENDTDRCKCLKRLEKLHEIAQQCGIFFQGEQAHIAENYVNQYKETIIAVRSCCIDYKEKEKRRQRNQTLCLRQVQDACECCYIENARKELEKFLSLGERLDINILRKQLELFSRKSG